jgi:hypothetical protein
MRRRTLLATAGAGLAGLAGCLTTGGPGSADGTTPAGDDPTSTPDGKATPTDEPTATDEPTTTADVSVRSARLQYGVVVPHSPDSIGLSNSGMPYLIAQVAVDGDRPRSDFTLAIGDERYDPARLDRYYRTDWGEYGWYERGRPGGLLLFDLSTADPDGDATLTWPGGEYSVTEGIGPRLAAGPPEFSASLSVPETHEGLDAPPVGIEVTNDDDVPRRFLGALNRTGPLIAYAPVARLSELVPPGESVALTVSDDWAGRPDDEGIGDGDPDVTYRLDYAGGEDQARIRLVESA